MPACYLFHPRSRLFIWPSHVMPHSPYSIFILSQELEAAQRGLAEQLNEERQGKRSIDALIDHQRSLQEERELQAEIEAVKLHFSHIRSALDLSVGLPTTAYPLKILM